MAKCMFLCRLLIKLNLIELKIELLKDREQNYIKSRSPSFFKKASVEESSKSLKI